MTTKNYEATTNTTEQLATGFIYKISNNVNNSVYVGSNYSTSLAAIKAQNNYNLKVGISNETKLSSAMRLLGTSAFTYSILESDVPVS